MYVFICKYLDIGFEVYAHLVNLSTISHTHPRGARPFESALLKRNAALDIRVFIRFIATRRQPFESASLCAVQGGHTVLDLANYWGRTDIGALLRHKGAKFKNEL